MGYKTEIGEHKQQCGNCQREGVGGEKGPNIKLQEKIWLWVSVRHMVQYTNLLT